VSEPALKFWQCLPVCTESGLLQIAPYICDQSWSSFEQASSCWTQAEFAQTSQPEAELGVE
jgi:hypothetical protein